MAHNLSFRSIRVLILLLLGVYASSITSAQGDKTDEIVVRIGISNFHILDEHASPLIYSGTGLTPSIYYRHQGMKASHVVEGAFYYNNLSTSAENFVTENFKGSLRCSYFYKCLKKSLFKRPFELYAGGSVASLYSEADYYFDMPAFQARSIVSWYWSHSLDLSGRVDYTVSDKSGFSFQFFMPLISNVSRPEYSPAGDYNYAENEWEIKAWGNTVFFPENLSFTAQLIYQLKFSEKFGLSLQYEFYYMKYDEPEEISMFMNNLKIGAGYYFK